MTPEIKAKLLALAEEDKCCDSPPIAEDSGFMRGAQAAWDLATQVSEDDERDAKEYADQKHHTKTGNPITLNINAYSREAFLAGRQGLKQAVQAAYERGRSEARHDLMCDGFISQESVDGMVQAAVEKHREAIQYLVNGAEMILDSYSEEIECRGDEDCDHCVLVSAIHNGNQILNPTEEKS
jgi:hypothetical protein